MSAQSTIDPETAAVIRSAMAAAQAGRVDEACAIGERGLEWGGDAAALNAMLGALLCSAGQFAPGIERLRQAHDLRPRDPVILRNLASALVETERYEDALGVLTPEAGEQDPSGHVERLRGYCAHMLNDFPASIDSYEKVVARFPADWETWNNLGNVRGLIGDVEGALAALEKAAALNRGSLQTRINIARTHHELGRFDRAVEEYRAAARDFPTDTTALGELYAVLQEQSRDEEGQEALEQATRRDPKNVGLLIALGRHYLLGFAIEEAQQTFRQVLALEPSNGDAFLGLADALEHRSPEDLLELLAEAERNGVAGNHRRLLEAMAARREGRHADALRALEAVPEDFDPLRRWHLVGQLSDSLGLADDAMAGFERACAVIAAEPTRPIERAAELRQNLRERVGRTTVKWRDSWQTPALEPEDPAPALLLGFPRSGTTLLDTLLMGHPDVEVMEERPVLATLRLEGCDFDQLAAMDEPAVRVFQARYFELARQFIPLRDGTLLIDKSPLHMQNLPQIARLFPTAKILLALRHPADVVLSAFMAKFRANTSMANFLSLETAADFYDLSFSLWESATEVFPVDVHSIRYEEMIADPEAALKPVVEWLGLSWDPAMLDHQRTARERGIITTASFDQVTQPIYSRSAGRWKAYRKHLEPILPTLEPWVRKLGYSLDP